MIFGFLRRKWTIFLWSLSGLISVRSPCGFAAIDEDKDALFVSDENLFRRSYRLEDFFWTGSGDGPTLEDSFGNDTILESKPVYDGHFDTWKTTTVFHTTTILFATVYPNSRGCSDVPCKPQTSPVWTGSIEFSSPVYPSFYEIEPTPTEKYPDVTRNLTILSEVTKVLTVTERVTEIGQSTGTPQIPASRNATDGLVASGTGEGSGAAYPRFDMEFGSTTASVEYNVPTDQKYWLLTVLKRENFSKELKVHVIEEKLSVLYKKAFIRQQEKHLGINGNSLTTTRPRRDRRIPEPVRVHIHNVSDEMSLHPNGIGLLYSVTVAGKPVPALTAANDMKLITENEVVAELGYPILTKAEPFLKGALPIGARIKGRTRDTWLLIGAVIAAVCLLIILAIVFTFGLSNRRESESATRGTNNKKHIFEAEEGSSNLAFQEDTDLKVKASGSRLRGHSSKLDSSRSAEGTTVTFADQRRESTSSSSCSGSSEASLVRLRHQQKKKEQKKEVLDEKPRPRPRTRVRRVENAEETLEDGSTSRAGIGSALSRDRESYGGMTTEGLDDVESTPRMTRTPPSYLSMPSVKAFPRGARIPEPLNRVLEPISIRYLDGDSETYTRHVHRSRLTEEDYETDYLYDGAGAKKGNPKAMTRHASLEGDPGVIGPVVWKRHYLKSDIMGRDIVDISEIDENVNIGKMRKRFNDLIDDAFSGFGSRNESSEEKDRTGGNALSVRSSDSRIHSAVIRPAESFYQVSSRPKTTDSKRPLTAVNQGPRGAWDSPICSTQSKPVAESPSIDKSSILVDSNLSPSDPAIPLIKAIKDELQKFDQVSAKRSDPT